MPLKETRENAAEFSFPQSYGPPVRLRVQALRCGAVRLTRTLRDRFLPDPDIAVIDRAPGLCAVSREGGDYLVDCGSVVVRISQEGSAQFLDKKGTALLREREKRPCVMEEKPVIMNRFDPDAAVSYVETADGGRAEAEAYTPYEARRAYACRLFFSFSEEEGLYGLGSHEEGCGSLRGRARALYQHNLKAVVPVLVSTRGWGVLFDLGCMMAFHDDAEGSFLWADCADEMDYYFMAGGYESVCAQYRALTGPAPLLPKYAFGYVQSKERYQTGEELLSVVREYRRRGVPLDLIVQDWMTWPDGQWGDKRFDRARYPDPQALTDALHALGAKLMISIWPSMRGDENENRKEMLENNGMLGNRAIYNAFDPKARALYWRQARDGLFRYGVDAWWCDCSEPFESDWRGALRPEPWERARINTEEAKKYLDPGCLSLYSLRHAQGIYEGQRAATAEKRVLNLTRSSWAGQHRFGTVTWSGDISATWETLRRQVPEGLHFMATGENYWTVDAGAFFVGTDERCWFIAGDFDGGVSDPGYRELFVRWMQYAAFLPMMRAHGTGTPREIWQFGEKGEPWYDALEKIICLRSRMVPYLYSLADAYSRCGVPMARVPALVFPDDPELIKTDGQMMLGNHVLVRPVTRPMAYLPRGKKIEAYDDTVSVYLPKGADWYDGCTGEKYAGGQTVSVRAPLDKVPVFIRAGGIIPLGPVRPYVSENPGAPLEIHVFPGADGAFVWYDDAGDGYGCERGECARVAFAWADRENALHISARDGIWPGMPKEQTLLIRLPGHAEKRVRYTGEAVTICF